MPIAESMLPEFDHETATTRTLLERVPDASAEWKPHAKSMSLGYLASHIANIPRWASATLERTEFDVNPPGGKSDLKTPEFDSVARVLERYDAGVSAAREVLRRTSDGDFMVQWTLKNAGRSMFSMPRASVFRSFVMNHAIHHRGQLSVYLRLLDVPLPSIYGPTADTE